ncbi:hypothetical protein Y032_0015g2637 [Ancylostoma ceylanicum]|nr:hypothetical protein Y032_0015g2637 [Ancylostoma ceylanicum]
MCGFHIRDEMQRRKDQRRINAFIARRKKKARKMPSAEIREGDFKYQGVLKMHGEIGEIKHALDDASSRSLEGVGFDRKYNELVVIGSAVEHIEVSQETTDASIRDTKSKTSTMKTASAERIKNLAEKIKSSAEKVKSTAEDQKQKANSAQRDSSVKKSVKHEPDHQRILSPSRKGRSSTVIPLHPQRSPTQKSVGLRAKLAALKNSSSKSMEGSMKSVEDAKEVEVSFKSEPASESVMALSNSFSARTAQARSTSRTERSPQQEERRLSPSHRSDRTKQPPELTPLRFLTSSTASEPAIENSATTENVHRPPLPFGTRYVGRMVNPTNVRSESFDEIDAANAARSAPRSLSASPRPRSRWTSVSPRPRRFHSGGRRRTKK